MSDSDRRFDPFADFINNSLQMDGVGVDQRAIAEQMRKLLRNLPSSVTPELWNDQLDSVQAVIRVCLDLEMILGAFEEPLHSETFTRDDLEILVMLSVTFAFVSYNRLHSPQSADDASDGVQATHLRGMLQAALGWVRKAAREGDPVAARFIADANSLLDETRRFGE